MKLVIFDFDGVIVGTEDICFNLNRRIDSDLKRDDWLKRFEGNINGTIWKGIRRKVDAKERARAYSAFFAAYRPLVLKIAPVRGTAAAIRDLARTYPLVIVSSTESGPIRDYLRHYGLSRHFAEVFGNDVSRSKVVKIKMLVKRFGVLARDAVLITDTLGDIREARQAGVGSIAAAWGYHLVATLGRGRPAAIVKRPAGLHKAVSNYFGNEKSS